MSGWTAALGAIALSAFSFSIILAVLQRRGMLIGPREASGRRSYVRSLRRAELALAAVVETATNGVVRLRPILEGYTDGTLADFEILSANGPAERFLGASEGARFHDLHLPGGLTLFRALSHAYINDQRVDVEVPYVRDQEERWTKVIAQRIDDEVVVSFVDMTDVKLRDSDEQANNLTDMATGLLNRQGFLRRASVRLDPALGTPTGALLWIGIEGVEATRQALGQAAADTVISEFASRMEQMLRPGDLVSRMDRQQFAVLIGGVRAKQAVPIAERIADAAKEGFHTREGDAAPCRVSVGVSLCAPGGAPLKRVLDASQRAMARARAAGGGVKTTVQSGTAKNPSAV